ncbi:copper transporter [Nocardioides sp. CFH 31398]|uniref:copper transporter n=1 Tax=Nocardioides sp. CFH 31398 TaxID=2919579 RepID=UPI001F063500|nr:copper transporter [Nocardioides sp. CFH 31398]MCH1867033.1 copper transporter [Nocardioides sp. CFH 31398]
MPAPTSLRRRLAPAAATVLALAVGIAVGAGPLSDVGTGTDQLATRTGAAPALTNASAVRALEASGALASATAPRVYDDRLTGRDVALLTMPGADDGVVEALREQVALAGGRVTGTYGATEELTGAGGTALVDSLGRRLLAQNPDLPVDADAPTYERMGGLLGMVLASREPQGQPPVRATEAVGESLRRAGLLTGPDASRTRAPLVLVVLGTDAGAEGDPAAVRSADAVTTGLLTGLAQRSAGTVVVDDVSSGAGGAMRRLRDSGDVADVSTVDGTDLEAGRVLAVLGLIRADEGVRGAWGVHGTDGAVPTPAS